MALKFVKAEYIRKIFNDERYQERTATGEFTAVLKKSKHPAAPRARMPVCTRSQLVAYLDGRKRAVAIVHQYVLPNGDIGASGRPDPKWLRHGGNIYQVI